MNKRCISQLLAGVALTGGLLGSGWASAQQVTGTSGSPAASCLIVTLTGTSGPPPFNGLAGPGTLVRYGDEH